MAGSQEEYLACKKKWSPMISDKAGTTAQLAVTQVKRSATQNVFIKTNETLKHNTDLMWLNSINVRLEVEV